MNSNLTAKKSLGQNFLKSKKALQQMITSADVCQKDTVVEIGPGKGALTRPLLETGAHVIAFELDQRMIAYLQTEFSDYIDSKQLQLIHKDVLDIDMEDFFGTLGDYKLIANIPYYITNAIIRKFLETEFQPTDMAILVQKEVAERIVVRDGKQSLLALAISVFGDARYIAKVDRKYFSPSPKIHSAIIHIGNISLEKIGNEERQKIFFEILHAGFAHKRKKLIRNLEKIKELSFWKEVFEKENIDENVRAEQIGLKTWISFVDRYQENK